MKFKDLFAVFVIGMMALSGTVVAGPGDKGKGSVVIEHTNSSGDGEGSVEIDVSVPAAVSHLDKHEDDCVVLDESNAIPDSENCDPVVEIVE